MSDSMRRTKGKQQGPRSQRVVRSVQEATVTELARVGYAQLTMDGVATAAGVHRTTLYRRWPSKQALVASLLDPGVERLQAAPVGEDLAEDLAALAATLAEGMTDPVGRALAIVLASEAPELRAVADEGRDRARAAFVAAFRRAAARGEIGDDVDVEARVHLLFFGVVHWALEHASADPEAIRRLVRLVLP